MTYIQAPAIYQTISVIQRNVGNFLCCFMAKLSLHKHALWLMMFKFLNSGNKAISQKWLSFVYCDGEPRINKHNYTGQCSQSFGSIKFEYSK